MISPNKRTFRYLLLFLAVFALAIASMGEADAAEKADLSRLVVVGDSLGAGFQNFSLYDSDSVAPPGGQKHGFAALIAHQAKVNLHLPLIQYPGIPPALMLEGKNIVRGTVPGTREPQTLAVQTFDLSVPTFNVKDALLHSVNLPTVENHPDQASLGDILAVQVLGYPSLEKPSAACGVLPVSDGNVLFSEATCAIELRPTTILVWLGNSDALQSLTDGIPPTDADHFLKYYELLIYALTSRTKAKVVVANIPDVTTLPFLVSYSEFKASCGVPPKGAGPADYVVPNLADLSFNICTNYVVRSASLIAQVREAVEEYNAIIARTAAKFHAVVVDVHRLYARISENGYDVAGHHLTAQFLGGIFSLDAIHPTNTGYAILANEFISRMNCELHTDLQFVNVAEVAKTDPLVF